MTAPAANSITVELPAPHPAQLETLRSMRRNNIWNCGRRFGKDVLLERVAVKAALPGEPIGWGAPSYKMMLENWRTLKDILYPATLRSNEQEKRIELYGGGHIEFWSLDNPDAVRGRNYKRFIINEAAMVPNLLDVVNLVIRPTLIDRRGSLDLGSTPKGLNGFYTLWSVAGDSPEWARFHYTSFDNPYIPKAELADLKNTMPERVYRQEILAEFLQDGGYFQHVTEAATIERPEQPDEHTDHYLVIGVDWALSQDYTVFTVGCRDCNRVVDWERFNQIDFTYQRERLYSLYERWHAQGVLPERNSIGEPNIEIIRGRCNILYGPDLKPGYQTTATSKPPLIEGLAKALEHDDFKVPKDYADELRSYEVEVTSTNPKFSAPAGQHDDRVISLALCRHAMVSSKVQIFV